MASIAYFGKVIACLSLASVAGCAAATYSIEPISSHVLARSTPDGIEVMNQTGRPVFYAAIEEGARTAAPVVPCTGDGCPSVAAGDRVVVPWSNVIEYTPANNDYMLYWCHEVRGSGGTVPRDSVHSLLVPR